MSLDRGSHAFFLCPRPLKSPQPPGQGSLIPLWLPDAPLPFLLSFTCLAHLSQVCRSRKTGSRRPEFSIEVLATISVWSFRSSQPLQWMQSLQGLSGFMSASLCFTPPVSVKAMFPSGGPPGPCFPVKSASHLL